MADRKNFEIFKLVTNALTLAGCVLILISLSIDIIHIKSYKLSDGLMNMQLIICLIFMFDFFVMVYSAKNRSSFFWSHIIILLMSIPYLNILDWNGIVVSKSWYIILKCAPLVRGFYGIFIAINEIVANNIKSLTISYLFSVLELTYLSALIFYAFEEGTNPIVTGFGNCLWWSGMSVTTVGASFFATTTIGKILSVFLPGLGMLMFPLFTVYVTEIFKKIRSDN